MHDTSVSRIEAAVMSHIAQGKGREDSRGEKAKKRRKTGWQ